MKQTVVDVLMYLFENIIDEDIPFDADNILVFDRLEEMGFPQHEILRAFDWLQDLAEIEQQPSPTNILSTSVRVYSELEMMLLDPECIGFLMYLEQTGLLTPSTRELILDRVIALDVDLDVEQLKWIVMIVLYSHPDEENAFAWMESMVFDPVINYAH
jgi:Smg protein